MNPQNNILVTGSTGYIGGRLVPALLEKGYRVRVLVRDSERIKDRPWAHQVEIVEGDVLKPETLPPALHSINTAYYLIHGMSGSENFFERDLIAAKNFSVAAKHSDVARIIYLGGLGDPETDLSEHLKSRQETGRALVAGGVPVTEFRAAIIVGSGSISFEMIRYLTERIPVMICPRWVFTRVQPISIRDVISYLTQALDVTESKNQIIEIGGSNIITYGEMMQGYAKTRGLKRAMIAVPVLSPRLSSYWVHWMTPVPAAITRPLIEGLRNEVIVRDDTAKKLFPMIEPASYEVAVERALANLEIGQIETRWTDSLVSSQGDLPPVVLKTQEGLIIERRHESIDAAPRQVFAIFTRLGGDQGWLYFDWAWQIRGLLDRLVGGVGLRRGRRHPSEIRVGDAVDFWRVEAIEPDHLLRLRAEMKVPGKAWLQFEVQSSEGHSTQLAQTAFFAPKGLVGLLYWYGLYPLHSLIFSGLIRKIKEFAEEEYFLGENHATTTE